MSAVMVAMEVQFIQVAILHSGTPPLPEAKPEMAPMVQIRFWDWVAMAAAEVMAVQFMRLGL